jgi:pyruvate formate lyase activating enzyme
LTVEALMDRVAAARPLFGRNGGVTFSGGEPTLQADDVLRALQELKRARIHTAVETNASTDALPRFADKADLIIADVKCLDPACHRTWVGADNRSVLQNLRNAADSPADLLVRITLVTGVNDSDEEMGRLTAFLAELAGRRKRLKAEVLRLHHLGAPKYAALEVEYPMKDVPCPTPEGVSRLEARLSAAGIALE